MTLGRRDVLAMSGLALMAGTDIAHDGELTPQSIQVVTAGNPWTSRVEQEGDELRLRTMSSKHYMR